MAPASAADLAPDELTVAARLEELARSVPFAEAVAGAFRRQFDRLNDRGAAEAISWLDGPMQRFRGLRISAIEQHRPGEKIAPCR